MKPTLIDRIVDFFNPQAGLRRSQFRMAADIQKRAYDAAKSYQVSDWVSANKGGANSEISAAQSILQQKSRDLARNNPYAVRAMNVIVTNTVGAGIVPQIKGKKNQVKRLTKLWKEVAETTMCDPAGRHNFYGQQALAMRAIVESGEVIGLREISFEAPRIKILESDFIDSSKDAGSTIQGIEFDAKGKPVKYNLFTSHPGERDFQNKSVAVPAEQVAHAFKQERPGQVRGVPWGHAVIEVLKDLADYQYATLIAKKVAACFVGFITTNDSANVLPPEQLKAKREAELQMTPGTYRYGNPGEGIHFSAPPNSQGYSEFVREKLREAAAGYGISYESFGDYSQVNFSSGRMGHQEMRRNIEMWRWNILIPHFCDVYAKWFLLWAQMRGENVEGVTFTWVPPAYVMIDPTKEIEALKKEVRSGFKTWPQAVREQGLDPEEVLREFAEWNKKFDDNQVTFDSDPRRMAGVGFAHPKDTLPLLNPEVPEMQPPEEVETSEPKEENDTEA